MSNFHQSLYSGEPIDIDTYTSRMREAGMDAIPSNIEVNFTKNEFAHNLIKGLQYDETTRTFSPHDHHEFHHTRHYSMYGQLFSQVSCHGGDRVRIEDDTKSHPQFGQVKSIVPGHNVAVQFDELYQYNEPQRINLKSKKIRMIPLTKAWLQLELRLVGFNNKTQSFTITGWINVFWFLPILRDDTESPIHKYVQKQSQSLSGNDQNIVFFANQNQDICMKILDLRKASQLSHYLALDANRIFFQPSLHWINHIEPPFLIYNTNTNFIRTQYHIKATLSEELDLFWFPFDEQFLNIKLRWNTLYYHALDWKRSKRFTMEPHHVIDIRSEVPHSDIMDLEQIEKEVVVLLMECTDLKKSLCQVIESYLVHDICWWGDVGTKVTMRRTTAYCHYPIKIQTAPEIASIIEMYPPFVDFRVKKTAEQHDSAISISPSRFLLIRLRFGRKAGYHVTHMLMPFFLIVMCSFSSYAIPRELIGERLAVAVTVLLTFTAFQNVITQELPQTSQMELIDWYILTAYGVQIVIIFNVSFPSVIQYKWEQGFVNEDNILTMDIVLAAICFIIWTLFTLIYWCKGLKCSSKRMMRRCCTFCTCCKCSKCCSKSRHSDEEKLVELSRDYSPLKVPKDQERVSFDGAEDIPLDFEIWMERGRNQIKKWTKGTKIITKFYMVSDLLNYQNLKKND